MLHHGADDALGVITVAGVRNVHVLTVAVELLPVRGDGENIRVFSVKKQDMEQYLEKLEKE